MRLLIPSLLIGALVVSVGGCTSSSKPGAGGEGGTDGGVNNSNGGSAGHGILMPHGGSGGAGGSGGSGGSAGDDSDSGVAGNVSLGGNTSTGDAGTMDGGGNPVADSGACSDGSGNDGGICDDGDACTIDGCVDGACTHDAVPMNDNDGCTDDVCDPLSGVSHSPVVIDDGDPCTADSCTSPAGTLHHDNLGSCTSAPDLAISEVGTPTVSDTMVVSGMGPLLRDLNVHTFITHTFSSDLSITLQSPTGTVVTLSSNNGTAGADVFNGTTWDDSANPTGQVPYTNNDGLVTDRLYVTSTLASLLVPEEPLAAFIGEDPNGTWTITIYDGSDVDGGALGSWSLDFTTFATMPVQTNQTVTNSTPVAIPDNASATSTLLVSSVAGGASICSVTVDTGITHTYSSDLDVTLTSPTGTVVTLTTDNGSGNDNVFAGTHWSDTANPLGQVPYTSNDGMVTDHAYTNLTMATPLTPEEALAAFIGESPNGTWTLTVVDDTVTDTGTLNSWGVNIGRCTLPP